MNITNTLIGCASVIFSFGCSGTIIVAISRFLSERVAKKLDAQNQLNIDMKFKKYEALLENKHHITKAVFDAEFRIYRELSHSFLELFLALSVIIDKDFYNVHDDDRDKRSEYDEETYKNVIEKIETFQNCLYENASFISKDIYQKYICVYDECTKIFFQFNELLCRYSKGEIELGDRYMCEYKREFEQIREKWRQINDDVRTYLSNLAIVE